MRLLPLIIAALVSAFLYLIVFERDWLFEFASGEPEAVVESAADTASQTETEDAGETERLIKVVALHSKAQTVDSAVLLRGRTEAARQVNVLSETSGKIISTPLRKGAYIEVGAVLCELKPGTSAIALIRAKAGLASSKAGLPEAQAREIGAAATLQEAQINHNAAQKLFEGGYASETRVAQTQANLQTALAGVQTARASVQSAEANIQAANAQVAAAQEVIDNLAITAPFSGLLESDTAELGALLQPGSLCATIIQLDPIKLVGFAPETEVDRITVGALSGARLATGQEVQGRVTFLSRSADALTRTFRVEVEIPNAGLNIRDGQTVEIAVRSEGESAHLLPQSSMTLNNNGDLGVRFVGPDNRVGFAPVTLLRDTLKGVWLTGLPDKVDVIISGQEYVIAGVKIDVTYREAKP